MAKDFAKRRKPRTKPKTARKKKSGFSFGSFIAGMVVGVGLFLATAYAPEIFERNAPITATSANAADTSPQRGSDPTQATEPSDAATPNPDVEFVFRDLLTEDAPAPDISAYEPISAPQTTAGRASASSHNQFLLQSGSFQILADAERRRGELLLMNLPANVVEAHIDENIWYRVVVGPFEDRSSANRVVTALRERQIAAILLARPTTN